MASAAAALHRGRACEVHETRLDSEPGRDYGRGLGRALPGRSDPARGTHDAAQGRKPCIHHRRRIRARCMRAQGLKPGRREHRPIVMRVEVVMTTLASRSLYLLGIAALLAGCAANTPLVGSVDAPHFAVGDHWRYRITDNLRRGVQTRLDVDVLAVGSNVASLRLVYTNGEVRSERVEEVDAGGGLRVAALGYG